MDRTYKKIELVGISNKSFEDAVSNAVAKAAKSLRGMAWADVTEQHCKIEGDKVTEYQVVMKVAFKID